MALPDESLVELLFAVGDPGAVASLAATCRWTRNVTLDRLVQRRLRAKWIRWRRRGLPTGVVTKTGFVMADGHPDFWLPHRPKRTPGRADPYQPQFVFRPWDPLAFNFRSDGSLGYINQSPRWIQYVQNFATREVTLVNSRACELHFEQGRLIIFHEWFVKTIHWSDDNSLSYLQDLPFHFRLNAAGTRMRRS